MENDDAYGPTSARHCDGAFSAFRTPSGDVEFYRALAREAGGSVLELGCGSGRVLLPIARDGIACTGLDSSDAMLRELARKSPPENLRLVPGAMQDFDLGSQRFSLVFSAFRSFQHPLTVEDQLSCLAAVRRHLAPGGLFAFGGDSGYRENGQLKSSGSAVIPRSPSTSYVIPSEARDLPS